MCAYRHKLPSYFTHITPLCMRYLANSKVKVHVYMPRPLHGRNSYYCIVYPVRHCCPLAAQENLTIQETP